MQKSIMIIAVLLAIVIIIVGIYYSSLKNNPSDSWFNLNQDSEVSVSEKQLPNISSNQTQENITIKIQNFSFVPKNITVKVGTKVTWINNDSAPHDVTSSVGNLLDSGTLITGKTFSFVFTDTGIVNYYCTIHPNMKGVITVEG